MIALDTAITLPLLRQTAARAWAWWIGELAQVVPAAIKNRLSPPRSEFVVQLTQTDATISRTDGADRIEVAHFDRSAGEDVFAQAAEALRTVPPPRLNVQLARAMVLLREFELPRSAHSKLRQIVGLDLDRQTPLTLDKAAYDVIVREPNTEGGRMRVTLAVTRRTTIDQVLSLCEKLGVAPRVIAVERADGQPPEFNLLPPPAGSMLPLWKRLSFLMASAVVLLAALNLVLAFSRLDTRTDRLSHELAKVRKEAQITEKLRTDLTRRQSEARLLSDARAQPNPLEILQDLTHRFPDEVWLFQLQISNHTVQVAGLAPSASDLIARLDSSDHFANPRFTAPVTRAEKPDRERFEITLDLRSAGQK